MKRLLAIAALMVVLLPVAYAAQDYNSSRSNNIKGLADAEVMLDEARADAMATVSQMFANDQRRDDYNGQYIFSVEVNVSLKRATEK